MRPVLFHLPDWLPGFLAGRPIPTYGILLGLGCLLGAITFAWLARRDGRDFGKAFEIALEPILFAIVAAKVVGVAVAPDPNMGLVRQLVGTGGIWYVGFLAGLAWAWWRVRSLGMGIAEGLDRAAVAVAVGHGVGRLGCLFAGCCYGSACSAPWAITYASERAHEMTGVPLGEPLHPAAVYESAGELAIAGFLAWMIVTRRQPFDGLASFLYLIGYATLRFVVEMFRQDPRGALGPLSTSQAIALAVLAVSIPLLVLTWRRKRRKAPVATG